MKRDEKDSREDASDVIRVQNITVIEKSPQKVVYYFRFCAQECTFSGFSV